MWLKTQDEEEVFWTWQDLAVFLGLAIPCLLGGAMIVKVALLALYVSTPHKALELLPGQFVGYGLLYSALALIFRTHYHRPFWRSLGWRWPTVGGEHARPFSIPSIVALGMALAFC